MSTNPGGASAADSSDNWREAPPHVAADISAATQFASARTQLGDTRSSASGARSASPNLGIGEQGGFISPGRTPSPMPSGSPAPGTSSPFAPTGLTAKMMTDKHGATFFIEQSTGMRIDILGDTVDRESQGSGPTPSDESDIPDTHTAEDSNTNAKMASLAETVAESPLTAEQEGALNQMRGSIAIGRERLFATTSLGVETQDELHNHHEELEDFKLEVTRRFDEMHNKLHSHHTQLNNCISENVKVLRDLGISESLLGKLVATTAKVRAHKHSLSPIPYQHLPSSTAVPIDLHPGVSSALPQRCEDESLEEFGRRAELLLARKGRAVAAFLPATTPAEKGPADDQAAPVLRTEDAGSISNAPRRVRIQARVVERPAANSISHTGYLTAIDEDGTSGDMFEEFRRETEVDISKIVEKHLGEELIVPSRIKAPKLDTPVKYTGTNDHLTFIRWVEALTAWMRTMFYGRSDPAVDKYRVSVLKNLLSDTALQWYIDFVEAPSPESPVPEDFVGVLCALHRRFITTATAHQALRDFEAVHFKAEGGPLRLMDDLEASAKRMREPMPDVIIRRRFMKLIPAALREDLQAVRGISESYASISQMRTHSEQLWDVRPYGRNHTIPRSNTPLGNTRTPPSARPNADLRRPSTDSKGRTANNTATPGAGIKGSILRPSRNSDKICFKCGIQGHIGSDPICSKYNEPPTHRERPRVGAQRVLESYSVDEEELDQEMAPSNENPEDNWGGSQYESDDKYVEPNPQADLANLVEANGEDEPRLGTIRYQYYSLRAEPSGQHIQKSAEELMEALPPNLRCSAGHDRTVRGDLSRISIHRRQLGLRQLSSNDETRVPSELRTLHHYPEDPTVQFESAAMEFETRHGGDGPWSRSVTDEWECLLLLQLAEHIRGIVRNTILDPLALTREHSAQDLTLMDTTELDHLMTQFTDRAQLLRVLRENMTDLNRQAIDARARVATRLETPRGSNSNSRIILEVAEDMLETLYRRKRYLVRLRYEHSLRSDLRDRLEGPVLDPNAPPVIYISDFESSGSESDLSGVHSDSDEEAVSRSPSPPPQYSENPDSAGEESSSEEMWETLPAPARELFEDPVQGPHTANGTPPARLGAMRVTESPVLPYYGLLSLPSDCPSVMVAEEEFAALGQTSIALQVQIARLKTRERHLALERDQAARELEDRVRIQREAMRCRNAFRDPITERCPFQTGRGTNHTSDSEENEVAQELL
ncbi:hypothetical protein K438DRAFT_1977660 [Mycena galopus ATCC 62051]|nr:hypothetical protein K438DRAFT_1977660 [Mycena galopus ATCC 62051]